MVINMILGKTSPPTSISVCERCMEGKQYVAKLGNDTKGQATKSLEIVHLDVCGLIRNTSMRRTKYLLLLLMIIRRRCGFT